MGLAMVGLSPCTLLIGAWAVVPDGSLATHSGCQQKELESGSVTSRPGGNSLSYGWQDISAVLCEPS